MRNPSRKGQQEVLSLVLITAVLVGIVGSVLFWGLPLIEKNKDISTLENAEQFMKNFNNNIKNIANNGGTTRMTVPVTGLVKLEMSPTFGQTIKLTMETQGTIYSSGEIPLGRNECFKTIGTWGLDEPEALCVTVKDLGDGKILNTYTLRYLILRQESSIVSYKIDLVDKPFTASSNNEIVIENKGIKEEAIDGKNIIKTIIQISAV